jgi:Transposase domain (DUF772)
MNATLSQIFMQRWNVVQHELIPHLGNEIGQLTPRLEKLIHILEWIQIEEWTAVSWCGIGRPPVERAWLANAFVAKIVLDLPTTVGLIDRFKNDRSLRRICGFPGSKKIPSETTFSRVFAEFAEGKLAERTHEGLIKNNLGDQLIGHISRDGTAIEARERPNLNKKDATTDAHGDLIEVEAVATATTVAAAPVKKRGRPRRGEVRAPAKESPISRQRKQTLAQMIEEIPTACDRGTKCNTQGYKVSWNGYKMHIDTADCGVPISAMISSASMQAAGRI